MEIDLLFHHLTSIVEPVMGQPNAAGGRCDRCNQEVQEGYLSKGAYYIYNHKNELYHCKPCHSLDVGDPEITGIERQAGTSGKFVPNKFGMMASTGALIEINTGKTLFFAPQKIIDKLPRSFTEKIYVRTELGRAQLQVVMNAEPPFLYISDFGRKTDSLVSNLKITTRHESVYACSDNGITELNLSSASKMDKVLSSVDEKQFSMFITTVSKLARGQLSPVDTGKQLGDSPSLLEAFMMMPVDPHLRLNLMSLLRHMRKG